MFQATDGQIQIKTRKQRSGFPFAHADRFRPAGSFDVKL
jgi:hypothetical protein